VKARSLVPLAATLLIVALCIANWGLLTETVSLSLLLGRVQAPLIVLLLLSVGIAALSSWAASALSTHAWRAERRRLASDLDKARGMAENEEESRNQALRTAMEREFVVVREKLDRLLARQAGLPGRERALNDDGMPATPTVIEPEIIPPRGTPPRRRH
jgi:uncharacterized integral membrane protein